MLYSHASLIGLHSLLCHLRLGITYKQLSPVRVWWKLAKTVHGLLDLQTIVNYEPTLNKGLMSLVKLDTLEYLTEQVLGSEIRRKEFKNGTHDASLMKVFRNIWNAKDPRPYSSCRVKGRGGYKKELKKMKKYPSCKVRKECIFNLSRSETVR